MVTHDGLRRASGDDPDPGAARRLAFRLEKIMSWSRRRFPVVDGPSLYGVVTRSALGHDANVP